MAKYRYVHTSFWTDPKVMEDMTRDDRYFYLYLLTNPRTSQIGIYPIAKKQIAFDLGYTIDELNNLMDRFENVHKLIKYNSETHEIAILKWGRYNLNKAGKPIIDCIEKELSDVKDKSLITLVASYISNKAIAEAFSRYVDDTLPRDVDDTLKDKSALSTQKEKENLTKKEKENKDKKTSCRTNKFADEHMDLAKLLFQKMRENNQNCAMPNLENWANEIRLMMERDHRTYEQVNYLINWSQQDSFWKTNILSPAKLRKQFDQLILRCKEDYAQAHSRDKPVPVPNYDSAEETRCKEEQEEAEQMRRYEEDPPDPEETRAVLKRFEELKHHAGTATASG